LKSRNPMARNRSEKVTVRQQAILVTLQALRELVRVNLEAGQHEDFGTYLTEPADLMHAANLFNKACGGWDPFDQKTRDGDWPEGGGWPGVLRFVESYAKEQGCAT